MIINNGSWTILTWLQDISLILTIFSDNGRSMAYLIPAGLWTVIQSTVKLMVPTIPMMDFIKLINYSAV